MTATSVKIGIHLPLTGPVAISGLADRKAIQAYFDSINALGGINGRKVELVFQDDGYDASKAVAAVKKLVEQDKVFSTFFSFGTIPTSATVRYVAQQGVPNMMLYTGAAQFTDPVVKTQFALLPTEDQVGQVLASYVKKNYAGQKIAVLYQNDDFGKGYLDSWQKIFGSEIVATQSFDPSAASLTSQVEALKQSNATVVGVFALQATAALAMKAMADLGWHPHWFSEPGTLNVNIIKNAGAAAAEGAISTGNSPVVASGETNADFDKFKQILAQYAPDLKFADNVTAALGGAELMADILKVAGKNLTRGSLVKAAEDGKFTGSWFGTVHMKDSHRAWVCQKLQQVSNGEVKSVGDVICPS